MKHSISLVTTHLDRDYLSLLMDAEIPDEANFKSETSDEPMENSASDNKYALHVTEPETGRAQQAGHDGAELNLLRRLPTNLGY